MEFDNVTFWKRLEEVSGGKSQVQIARDCGIGLNSDGKGCSKISKWKSGDSIPDIRDLMAIAQTYHCSVDYLVGLSKDGVKGNKGFGLPTVKDVLNIVSVLRSDDLAQVSVMNGWARIEISDSTSGILVALISSMLGKDEKGTKAKLQSIYYNGLIKAYGDMPLGFADNDFSDWYNGNNNSDSVQGYVEPPDIDDAELPPN